jgi:LacI family transcriptional regulator
VLGESAYGGRPAGRRRRGTGRQEGAGGSRTIFDVARRAGVSPASVSRTLGGKPGVSEANRRRVMEAVEALAYVPNGSAQGLASRRHGVIGLLLPELDDPSAEEGHETLLYADQVLRGAERAARAAGYAVLVAAIHGPGTRGLVHSVCGRVDGLVALARSVPDSQLADLAKRLPLVLLAARQQVDGADLVAADNEGGSYAVTEHLVQVHGYERVVFAGGPPDSPDSQARFDGYAKAMAAGGLLPPARPTYHGDFSEAGGRRVASEILSRKRLPEAVVVANDQMAVGLLSALSANHVRVPDDIALTGFDDIQLGRFVTPALTTVHQPMRELGATSANLLLERLMAGGSGRPSEPAEQGPTAAGAPARPCKFVLLPTTLVVRESCGCLTRREPA